MRKVVAKEFIDVVVGRDGSSSQPITRAWYAVRGCQDGRSPASIPMDGNVTSSSLQAAGTRATMVCIISCTGRRAYVNKQCEQQNISE